jgi:hypothetical protein
LNKQIDKFYLYLNYKLSPTFISILKDTFLT